MRLIKSKLATAFGPALLAIGCDAQVEADDEARTVRVTGHDDNAFGYLGCSQPGRHY